SHAQGQRDGAKMAHAAPRSPRAAEAPALDPRRSRHRGTVATLRRAVSRGDPDSGRWDIGVALYLALAFWMIAKSEFAQIHRQSLAEDESSFAILVLTIVSAAASVGAVFAWFEFATHAETFTPAGLIFVLVTIMLSKTFIHTMFALHYTRTN